MTAADRPLNTPLSLQRTASEALRDIPGAVALYAFGSLAQGTADAFSDVDLELFTTDLGASVSARHAVLGHVGPLALEWRISPSRSDWASTLLFEHLRPYHKLDLGVTTVRDGRDPGLPGGVLLWRQRPSAFIPGQVTNRPLIPDVGTPEHWLLGHILSSIRYVKARKRGQELTCWRFASALANAALTLLHAKHAGTPLESDRKLSTLDYLELDNAFPGSIRSGFLRRLNFSSPERMDHTVLALLGMLAREPAAAAHVTDRLLDFVEHELSLPGGGRCEELT